MSRIFKVLILSLFLATSSMAGSDGQNELSKDANGGVKDCFETVNRGIFAFNQAIDGLIFEPLAKGYLYLPSPIRTGTSNFVGNLSTLLTIPNNVLQGDLGIAGKNTLRFIVNSTVGIVGLFDPATAIGLNSYEKEDFGQTLGSWGVGEGCYVVLPVLGPSTARDALGSLGNYMGGDAWYNVTVRNDTHYFSDFDYYASKGAGGVDFRAKNFDDINNLEENSIDFYASVKSLYLQDRRKRILNARGATQTQDDSDWEEIE
ncbi:VacJ family lipoprotein [Candidatus Pelagibacter sp.]|jgi:phospholipid-binding lipoprotein MlaA|nr:VacJ family lipoprotein [Candidatus Pelagibacter sp.]